ncbi:hypothetical protein EJB05_49580, partial [Eragrostis curvula]
MREMANPAFQSEWDFASRLKLIAAGEPTTGDTQALAQNKALNLCALVPLVLSHIEDDVGCRFMTHFVFAMVCDCSSRWRKSPPGAAMVPPSCFSFSA